ncbi:MAG: FecR domain-containing protein [Elusimicrobia bacterium]|nr:FecR domain-containing protein [Elusimicrobiota bacterium]
MKVKSGLLLALLVFAFSTCFSGRWVWAQDPVSIEVFWDVRITGLLGRVEVYQEASEDWIEAEVGMPLEQRDLLRTGSDSYVEFSFNGEHLLRLEEASTLRLQDLKSSSVEMELPEGSLLLKLKERLFSGREFRIRTPVAVASVRGTEFAVESKEEEAAVGVFEGEVWVAGLLLQGGKETEVRRGQPPGPPRNLKRFLLHRRKMRDLRKRVLHLRKSWRRIPLEKRQQLRRNWLKRRAAPGRIPRRGVPRRGSRR